VKYEEYLNDLLERAASIKNDTQSLINKIDMNSGGCWCNEARWVQADLMAILQLSWSLEVALKKFNDYHRDFYFELNHYYGKPPLLEKQKNG